MAGPGEGLVSEEAVRGSVELAAHLPPHHPQETVLRIRMVLGLPDPDPLVKDTDPDPDTSIIKQK